MKEVILAASAILTLAGSLVVLVAMLGVWRFPDVYCRAHALGKGLTLGLALLLVGLWLDLGGWEAGWKTAAALGFQFMTLPIASHLLARLSFAKRIPHVGAAPADAGRP